MFGSSKRLVRFWLDFNNFKRVNILGERVSIDDASRLSEVIDAWNGDSQSNQTVFSQVNCYDYSEFCSLILDVYQFPSYRFYVNGKMVLNLEYLPENVELINLLNK